MTQLTTVDDPLRRLHFGRKPKVQTKRDDPIFPGRRIDHEPRLCRTKSGGLFTQDVASRLEGGHRRGRMEFVGRADAHGVQVFLLKHLAVILVGLTDPVGFCHLPRGSTLTSAHATSSTSSSIAL